MTAHTFLRLGFAKSARRLHALNLGGLLVLFGAAGALLDCADEVVTGAVPMTSGNGGNGTTAEVASTIASSSASGSTMVKPQACPEGMFATGFDAEGTMLCGGIGDGVAAAINSGCALHFGWRDTCNNCMDAPAKWGRVNGVECVSGNGDGNTCAEMMLGTATLPILGVNLDGNVNGDDKFYVGLHCPTLGESAAAGPCEPGEVAVSWNETGFHTCYPIARLAARYVQESCSVYFGWRDGCDACTEPPSKWGHVEMLSCANGSGDDGTCTTPLLDGRWVTTFGLNTDGDVNGDDTFYAGLRCASAEGTTSHALGSCPPGKALIGIEADGALVCASLAPAISAVARKSCSLYFGWRDTCEGCADAPSNWGRTSTESCEVGAGAESTCVTATLGQASVPLVAIGTAGDVNGDDTFYTGFHCVSPPP